MYTELYFLFMCHKCPQNWQLKQHPFITSQFWESEDGDSTVTPSAQDSQRCTQDMSLAVFSSEGSEEESASKCIQVVGRTYLLVAV